VRAGGTRERGLEERGLDERGLDERGLATPVVVVLTGMLVVVSLLGASLGRLLVDQRRAASAADLAALAGAAAVQRGSDPCGAASDAASRNDAELVACDVIGEQVVVRATVVSSVPARLLGRSRPVSLEAEARAGPVSSGVPVG
jgi:secretion/DNA translocation related TadE-like protein